MDLNTSEREGRPEMILLVDDDFTVREAVAAALERKGRKIITCADLESAQLLLETFPFHAAIADVRLTGPFGFEGLELVRYASEKVPPTRVVLISGNASQELRREAAARGAVALLQKPFCIEDIEAAIGSGVDEHGVTVSQTIEVPTLDTIFLEQRLFNMFQPIVTCDGDIFGYESLARIHAPLNDPAMLFQYAERKRRLLDLELECVRSTFCNVVSLPPAARLFVNVHPQVLALGHRFTDEVIAAAASSGVALDRVVFEITEQAALGSDAETAAAIVALRAGGADFAFDDVGVAYSHYADLPRVQPSFFKVSQEFGTAFESDPYRTKIVRNITSLAEEFGIAMILEGVESESTAIAARQMGIPYLQGYWFGRPMEASKIAGRTAPGVN